MCGKILVGVEKVDKPFTSQERKEMMQRALQAKNLIPMFDINFIDLPERSADWADKVLEATGPVDKLWCGDEETKKLFEGKIEVQNIAEVPGISCSEIQEKMKTGGDWQWNVPDEVVTYIREVEGLKRIT